MNGRRTNDPPCALAATRRTARLMTQFYDACLSEAGIEAAQFALLMTLDATEGTGQAALAQMLGMDKTTLSRNLKLLRDKDWVESAPGKDARRRSISLTIEGRARLREARPAWRKAGEELRQGMTEREWAGMWASLEAINRAVTKAEERRNGS
jgi:DNA-binding MarR family transcriptional regulator